jgi:pimeloyl-ACP methyl ester carboxylesterase
MLTKPVRDEYIIAGDLTFHSMKWGERGQPLVCVHGITANAYCFQALADGLANDYQVFAYDLRGRGDSDKPESGYSIPIHAADLAALIDELGLDRPVIIGHSLGALIGLYFAAHYPEKLSRLVLIDTGAPLPWKTSKEQPAWLTGSIARLGVPVASFEEYTQRLKVAPFLGPYWNDYLELYFEQDVYRNSDGSVIAKGSRTAVLEEQQNLDKFNPEEQWARVRVPTLLMRAGLGLFTENDQLLPEELVIALQRGIQNCTYVNFPRLNHYTIVFGVSGGPAREIREFVDVLKE